MPFSIISQFSSVLRLLIATVQKLGRTSLAEFLSNLESTTSFLSKGILEKDLDFAFVGFANRFIKVNPDDVSDRIETIKRVHTKIQNNGTLLERDFQFLDRLQSYLEEEVAQSVQGLFRL